VIRLRDYAVSDIPRLVELANNWNVSRYLIYTFPYPYTELDATWWVNTGHSSGGAVTRVIELDGEFVGSVGIQPQIGWRAHCAEIGYWIGEPYWGRGVATEALRQMSDLAMQSLGFRKLFAPVLAPNVPSMRVLEKCGYVEEGLLRAEVYKDSTYYDVHLFALQRL